MLKVRMYIPTFTAFGLISRLHTSIIISYLICQGLDTSVHLDPYSKYSYNNQSGDTSFYWGIHGIHHCFRQALYICFVLLVRQLTTAYETSHKTSVKQHKASVKYICFGNALELFCAACQLLCGMLYKLLSRRKRWCRGELYFLILTIGDAGTVYQWLNL